VGDHDAHGGVPGAKVSASSDSSSAVRIVMGRTASSLTLIDGTLNPVASPKKSDTKSAPKRGSHSVAPEDKLPIKMMNDRVLVEIPGDEGERRSTGGILIPATAQVSRRLAWAEIKAVGPNVRMMEIGDQVLFNPDDRYEVEVRNHDYIILRERDIHAVAAERLEEGSTGLYM